MKSLASEVACGMADAQNHTWQQELFEHDGHPDDFDRDLDQDEPVVLSDEEVSYALVDKLKARRHTEFVQLVLGET